MAVKIEEVLIYLWIIFISIGITASQESITLTEREPVTLPEPEVQKSTKRETNDERSGKLMYIVGLSIAT